MPELCKKFSYKLHKKTTFREIDIEFKLSISLQVNTKIFGSLTPLNAVTAKAHTGYILITHFANSNIVRLFSIKFK